jgi:hypothetical protein
MQRGKGEEKAYHKECSYSNKDNNPTDLLISVSASRPASSTTSNTEVRERICQQHFEKSKNAHRCEAFEEMLNPGRLFLGFVVVPRPAARKREVAVRINVEIDDGVRNKSQKEDGQDEDEESQ